MTLTITQLPGMPIVLAAREPDGEAVRGLAFAIARLFQTLDEQPEPVFMIVDITRTPLRIDQLSMAAEAATHGNPSLLHHPNLREAVFVTNTPTIRTALGLLTYSIFGQVRLAIVDTREQALAYCQEKLGMEVVQRSPATC